MTSSGGCFGSLPSRSWSAPSPSPSSRRTRVPPPAPSATSPASSTRAPATPPRLLARRWLACARRTTRRRRLPSVASAALPSPWSSRRCRTSRPPPGPGWSWRSGLSRFAWGASRVRPPRRRNSSGGATSGRITPWIFAPLPSAAWCAATPRILPGRGARNSARWTPPPSRSCSPSWVLMDPSRLPNFPGFCFQRSSTPWGARRYPPREPRRR